MTTQTTIKDTNNTRSLDDDDNNNDDDDDNDNNEHDSAIGIDENTSSSVQLGFCVEIDNDEHLQDVAHRSPNYHDWDGGQVGGRPVWLDPEHVPRSIPCLNCCNSSKDSDEKNENNNNNNKESNNVKQTPRQMRFICQIYAPVDFDDGRAFHRSLYVFACPDCCGLSMASGGITSGIRVLRCQLPAENPYFPANPDQEVNWKHHLPESWNDQHLCVVCGLKATGQCPLQQAYFCGAHHQREYKQYNNKATTKSDTSATMPLLPSVYHMTELVVEEEPETLNGNKNNTIKKASGGNHDDSGEYDFDPDLEQDDLNEMIGANPLGSNNNNNKTSQDATTMRFYQRIQERPDCQDQCLRYCRWSLSNNHNSSDTNILWIRQDAQPPPATADDTIPSCPYCGGQRRFEFQLMPQMLHYLLQNRPAIAEAKGQKKIFKSEAMENNNDNLTDWTQLKQALQQTDSLLDEAPAESIPPDLVQAKKAAIERVQQGLLAKKHEIDWGVVAVYTCINSCDGVDSSSGCDGDLGGYKEEYAWVQPSLDTI